ncbi:MAG: DUF2191 domain-containing protein [Acidobacteriota bacterium]
MRTTTRIDDDLLDELKEQARKQKTPLTKVLNRTLRAGMSASRGRTRRTARHQEKTYAMGRPRINLGKALGVAARLEDEEILRKLMLRK